jgi:Fe-S-cluster containining protein
MTLPPASSRDLVAAPLLLGGHVVPGVWRYLFPDDPRTWRLPKEERATCGACPKIVDEGFRPDVKCCSIHPRVPNFLLGFALEDPATAPFIEALIAERFATPEGLQATSAQTLASLEQRVADRFGRDDTVRCRFLDASAGRCRIYAYRNSICSTFFCLHDQGPKGGEFWDRLQAFVGQRETAVAQWAMAEAGMDVDAYFARMDGLASDVMRHSDPATQSWTGEALRALWGDWLGREAELYRACAQLVRAHRDRLSDLADAVPVKNADAYDLAFAAALSPPLRAELEEAGPITGTPVPSEDLWYMLKLALRNLWLPDGRA